MKISLIRHGRTIANEKGIYAGLETPLSPRGAEDLRNLKFPCPEILLTSPATRARETATILFGREGEVEDRLLEISYGEFEGLSFQEAEKNYPKECAAWIQNPYKNPPPGGESISMLLSRLEGLLKDFKKKDRDLVCVTHEGVIRGILALVLQNPSAYFKFKIVNGGLTKIEAKGSFWQILQINYR